MELVFRIRNTVRRIYCYEIVIQSKPCGSESETGRRTGNLRHYKLQQPCSGRYYELEIIVHNARIFINGSRRIFCRFRNTLCRRVYKWTCHYGIIQFTVSVADCYHLLYDWWIYYGKSDFTGYSLFVVAMESEFLTETFLTMNNFNFIKFKL